MHQKNIVFIKVHCVTSWEERSEVKESHALGLRALSCSVIPHAPSPTPALSVCGDARIYARVCV